MNIGKPLNKAIDAVKTAAHEVEKIPGEIKAAIEIIRVYQQQVRPALVAMDAAIKEFEKSRN